MSKQKKKTKKKTKKKNGGGSSSLSVQSLPEKTLQNFLISTIKQQSLPLSLHSFVDPYSFLLSSKKTLFSAFEDQRLESLFGMDSIVDIHSSTSSSVRKSKLPKINLKTVNGNLFKGVSNTHIVSLFGSENHYSDMIFLCHKFFSEISELLQERGMDIHFENLSHYYLNITDITEKMIIEKILQKLRIINKCVFELWWKHLSEKCNHELIMIAPGSTNVTSDWDITIIPTYENMNELLKSMSIYSDIMGAVSGYKNPSEIYDYNIYFEGLQCNKKEKLLLESLSMDCIRFHGNKHTPGNNNYMFIFPCNKETVKLELKTIQSKMSQFSVETIECQNMLEKHMDGMFNQLNELNEMYYSLYEEKDVSNAFYHYLQSRLPKSEAYFSYSAFFCVVIVNQMGIEELLNTSKNIEWRLIVSAYENTVDGIHHLQNSKQKNNGTIDNTDIIKYSKYLYRICETLIKSFEKMNIDLKIYPNIHEIINRSKSLVNVRGKVSKMKQKSIDKIVNETMAFNGGEGTMKKKIIKQIQISDKMIHNFVQKDMDYGLRLIGIMSSLQGLCKHLLDIYIE